MKYLKKFEDINNGCSGCPVLSEELQYALEEGIMESFRFGSDKFFDVINEARERLKNGDIFLTKEDIEFLNTDIGKTAIYEGEEVYLDFPMLEREYRGKNVKIGKPFKDSSGSKPYAVYVINEKNNVIKVSFGSGMRAKISDPEARKRYDQRHGCSKGRHNDKTKAGYWSCRLPRYAKALGLSYSGSAKWW